MPARFFPASRLLDETPRLTERSDGGVSRHRLLGRGGGRGARRRRPRRRRWSCQSANRAARPARSRERPEPIAADDDRPPARQARHRRHRAGRSGLAHARKRARLLARRPTSSAIGLYLDLLGGAIAGKTQHPSAIGEEEARVRQALDLAAAGRKVALVSSGDAGIYGLAPLVFELLDRAPRPDWQAIELVGLSRRLGDAGRRRPRRRAARPRFLRDLAVRSADPVGRPSALGWKRRQPAILSSRSTTRARRDGRRASPRRRRSCCTSPAADAGLCRTQSRPRRRNATYPQRCPNSPPPISTC